MNKRTKETKETKKPKTSKKKLVLVGGIAAITVIILAGITLLIGSRVFVSSNDDSKQNIVYDNDAKDIMQRAITMTQVYNYEPEHGNFNGMNASELKRLDPKGKYVDGRPDSVNEVGILDVVTDGFYLVCISKSGREFTARKKPGQGIKLNYWTIDPRKVPSKE